MHQPRALPLSKPPPEGEAARAQAARPALPTGVSADPMRFGRFELQVRERQLLDDGRPCAIQARALDLLIVLVQRTGQLVSRTELLDLVWPGLVVEDGNLSVQINSLRKLLGSDTVATVPGRGYRFVAPATVLATSPLAPSDALPDSPTLRTNLPEVLPELTGREADLDALAMLVDQHRLVTVLGPAGIGKTCIARALLGARQTRYVHGVCFIELAALSDRSALARTIAAALGLPQPDGDHPNAMLVRQLAPLTTLIALDNAEHLAAEVAILAAALIEGAPDVRLLVTSQVPLKLAAEQHFRLGALAVPADDDDLPAARACGAVALFTLRAQARDRHFALTADNLPLVISLCRQLDGSPLAIELAAARVRSLGLPALLRRMDQRLRLLTDGRRDASDRHQSLRAALAWSHGLLGPVEQQVFRRLTVFVGPFSLAAALAVLAEDAPGGLDEWSVLDALCTLVDYSLIDLLPAGGGPDDAPRYRYLDTPRAFAGEQLLAADERPAMRRRHAQAMRGFYNTARHQLYNVDQHFGRWLAALVVDADDGLAAVTWAIAHDPACALDIAPVVSRTIRSSRHADCKAMWLAVEPLLDAALDGSLAAPAAGPLSIVTVPPSALANAAWECGKFWANTRSAQSTLRCQQAVAQARLAGDRKVEFIALGELGWGCGCRADLAGLQALVAERQALYDPTWPRFIDAASFEHEEWLYALQNDQEGEIRCLARLAERSRLAGLGDATYLANMTTAYMDAGRYEEALAHVQARVTQAAGRRVVGSLRHDLNNLVRCCLALGQTERAREALRDFWPLAQYHDMQARWADAASSLAALEQRPQAAMALLGHADAVFGQAGTPRQPGEQKAADRVLKRAAAILGEAAADSARQQGRVAGLTDEALNSLGLGRADGARAMVQ